MADKQCPKCSHWVSEEERLSGQCPFCKSFFESTIPVTASTGSATGAPVIRTDSPTQQSRRRSAPAWPAWIVIPLFLVGMRACNAIVRQSNRPPPPQYSVPEFGSFPHSIPEGEFTIEELELQTEELERINELLRKHKEVWATPRDHAPASGPAVPSESPASFPNSTDNPLGGLLPSDSTVDDATEDAPETNNVEPDIP